MKISLNWLADYITLNEGLSTDDLVKGLIQLGHEVDAVHNPGAAFANVVVGKIISREQHPNADRLGVCVVDVGTHGTTRQIVCGAANARAGLTVAVALPGAVLPGNFTIGASEIRGVQSNGMICSLDELGMATERAEGIWEMKSKSAPGTPLAEDIGLNDTVLEVAVTPNRGDCLSHYGLARDIAALGLGKLKTPKLPSTAGEGPAGLSATIATPDCEQFNWLRVSGVKNGQSPAFMRARLEAAGVKPKSLLVDVTNYVMLALGQPMHAYDAAKLQGDILVRAAKPGETFKGLADTTLTLNEGDIAITDSSGVIGLGGILGGAESAVSDATTDVILEAAHFNRQRIALTGQAHKLFTDARSRFERGIDPAMTQPAIRWAAALLAKYGKGKLSSLQSTGPGVPAPQAISYNPTLTQTFGGLPVDAKRQKTILKTLGFGVEGGKQWAVTPPTFRTYMQNPEDIVEEVLRVVGYENIPATLPAAMGAQGIDGRRITLDRTARKALAAAGFTEAMTYSFIGLAHAKLFADESNLATLDNPLAEDSMTTMRPSLLPGLLRAAAGNAARKDLAPRLGEVGKTFSPTGEKLMAAGVLTSDGKRNWRKNMAAPDVFIAKAAALKVLALLGAPVDSLVAAPNAGSYYHPGKSGTLSVGPMTLARFGELHPKVTKGMDIGFPVAVFEVDLETLLKVQAKQKPFIASTHMPVRRDVALVLDASIPAAAVQATLRGTNRELISNVEVFDVYVGDHVPQGKKSLALALTIHAAERTLTEAELSDVVNKAVAAAQSTHGATVRA
jgi:phenylalanyl-tRNA synthetase beta chain